MEVGSFSFETPALFDVFDLLSVDTGYTITGLVYQETRLFNLVWECHSKHPIYYENHKIYQNSYRSCYTVNGVNEIPRKLYELPSCPPSQKIADAVTCEAPLTQVLLPFYGHRPCFLALTANGWLYRYDSDTGQILEQIFLSRAHRFKYISWNDQPYSVVVKSVLSRPCPQARRAGFQQSHLVTLCMLTVLPLEFVAMFEVHRNLFGKDITDAMICESLLITIHHSGFVRLYSFQQILQEGLQYDAQLGKECSELGGITGSYPLGLPLNVRLNGKPPVLFEVRCAENDLKIGGIPWHYIVMPCNNKDIFQVYSLKTQKLAQNGILDSKTMSIRPDKALFHPDESGRILHISSSELRVFRLSSKGEVTSVSETFNINMSNHHVSRQKAVIRTSSGRTVRHRQMSDMTDLAFEQALVAFNYENEVDLLVILGADHHGNEEEDGIVAGHVYFYDNHTGKCLKKVRLKRSWVEHMENNIILDLDVLVNIRKETNGKHSCYVYRLTVTGIGILGFCKDIHQNVKMASSHT